MALAFSSTPLAPTELEDAATRPSRPRLNFAWPRATRSATTSLGPEQLARPRIYLAPSNSLGHDVDFTWPRATRSVMPPLLPATSMQLAQPPLRDRSASATSPASSSIRQPFRSTSLDLEQLAQSPIQPSAANSLRHRNDTASSVVSFLQLRTPHPLAHRLSASITSSPHTWPTCLGQACRPCCLNYRYRPFEHSVSVFLSSSPSLSLFESSLTIRLGFSLFNLKFFTIDS